MHATLRIPLLNDNYDTKTYKRKHFKECVKQALEAPQFQLNNIDVYLPNFCNIKRILRGSFLHFTSSAATRKQLEVKHTHTHTHAARLFVVAEYATAFCKFMFNVNHYENCKKFLNS